MRPFVIVTTEIENGGEIISYDMELPTEVPVKRLCRDIFEFFRFYPEYMEKTKQLKYTMNEPAVVDLYCKRLQQDKLPADRTLAELGVWSGDILTIR